MPAGEPDGGDDAAATIAGDNLGNGDLITYTWRFGDDTPVIHSGSGLSATYAYTYTAVGSYTAVVTATNSISQVTASTLATVNDRAITGLSAASSGPTRLGSATAFTATILDGSNVTYAWEFGDGSTGSGANPSYTYASIGVYTATVTASNGVSQVVASSVVAVDQAISGLQLARSGQGPVALGSVVAFAATTTAGSNVGYSWDFGDGVTGSGASVTHRYAVTGTYTVIVTATNSVDRSSAQVVIGAVHGWTPMAEVLIPAGSFQMGCDSGRKFLWGNADGHRERRLFRIVDWGVRRHPGCSVATRRAQSWAKRVFSVVRHCLRYLLCSSRNLRIHSGAVLCALLIHSYVVGCNVRL